MMESKKVKLVYFSLNGSEAKELELSWKKFLSMLISSFLVLTVIAFASLALLTDFYEDLQNSSLSKQNVQLKTRLAEVGTMLTSVKAQVRELEHEDDDLRVIADLPQIDSDTRFVGVGGSSDLNYDFSNGAADNLTAQLLDYQSVLDQLERRIELNRHSRLEVKEALLANAEVMRHTPSISPILDGRIRSKFGRRLHPILERVRKHPGIDISAPKGTEVWAAGAGVVERVVVNYKINRSWGRYVLINHGYGLKTLYGHLSKILVRKGQKVDRWKAVGLVGETGLATGPHLHYEVRKDGQHVDPTRYILNDYLN